MNTKEKQKINRDEIKSIISDLIEQKADRAVHKSRKESYFDFIVCQKYNDIMKDLTAIQDQRKSLRGDPEYRFYKEMREKIDYFDNIDREYQYGFDSNIYDEEEDYGRPTRIPEIVKGAIDEAAREPKRELDRYFEQRLAGESRREHNDRKQKYRDFTTMDNDYFVRMNDAADLAAWVIEKEYITVDKFKTCFQIQCNPQKEDEGEL